jgi:LysR family transcriptional regulator, hypochlorite-specific transcription factor HypT
MQTDWLIDFRTLAETRNFSRAARLRHITQPAFSRRIRSLEDWAEATLVDRSCHPTQLTPAGDLLLARVPGLIASIQRTHVMLRSHTPSSHDTLAFAASPWLASGFFPAWITGLYDALNHTCTRMTVLEPQAGLQHLVDGNCDLLLVHACDDLPPSREAAACEFLSLGQERLLPCSRPQASGAPLHSLPGHSRQPLAYLAHATDTELARTVESALRRQPHTAHLQRVFECDSLDTLKAMALTGAGIAFLPESHIHRELEQGLLVQAGDALDVVLEVRLLRRRPAPESIQGAPSARLWSRLLARLGAQVSPVPADRAAAGQQRTHPELVELI